MNPLAVFTKTDLGRQEVKSRSGLIDQRSRSLLLLVDGKTAVGVLLDRVAGLAITEDHFATLVELDLIALAAANLDNVAITTGSSTPQEPLAVIAEAVLATLPPPLPSPMRPPVPHLPTVSDAEKCVQISSFLNQTAKNQLGMFAAVGFQQKVASASTLADLRKLRQPMIDAVAKSKNELIARSLGQELDRLLNL